MPAENSHLGVVPDDEAPLFYHLTMFALSISMLQEQNVFDKSGGVQVSIYGNLLSYDELGLRNISCNGARGGICILFLFRYPDLYSLTPNTMLQEVYRKIFEKL